MKKIIYRGDIYTVEEESSDFYKLSGNFWVKKSACTEITDFKITFEGVFLALAVSFFVFHLSRILIIEIAKL